MVLAILNVFAGWQLFRGYDKLVMAGVLLANLSLIARMPRARRMEGQKRPLAYWIVLGFGLAGAIAFALLLPKG